MNKADAQICQMIEAVISGQVSEFDFFRISREWPDGASRKAQEAWHAASHYLADADIRERDAAYASAEIDRLRWHISSLRGDAKTAAE